MLEVEKWRREDKVVFSDHVVHVSSTHQKTERSYSAAHDYGARLRPITSNGTDRCRQVVITLLGIHRVEVWIDFRILQNYCHIKHMVSAKDRER